MDFMPEDIARALRDAPPAATRRMARQTLRANGAVIPVLRRWTEGFALDPRRADGLPGLVDFYENGRHAATWLIVASEIRDDELICLVKREQAVLDRPPADFVRDPDAPAALLPRA